MFKHLAEWFDQWVGRVDDPPWRDGDPFLDDDLPIVPLPTELHYDVVITTTAPPEKHAQVGERLAREVELRFGDHARVEYAGKVVQGQAE